MESTEIIKATEAFESTWHSEFCIPKSIVYDPAFKIVLFIKFLSKNCIYTRSMLPRHHINNMIKSNTGFCGIFN